MSSNSLRTYFKGVAAKYLSAVDATRASNQHEIGSNKFKAILGDPGEGKLRFETTFIFFNPDLDEAESCQDRTTYYDSRLNQKHRSPELRLYYRDNPVTEQLREGDFCLVGALASGGVMVAIARPGTEYERRLRFLFETNPTQDEWEIKRSVTDASLDLARESILSALGIEVVSAADALLDDAVHAFGLSFPTTREFSDFARVTCTDAPDPRDDADATLEAWMKHEERLFRSLERAIVEVQLRKGFATVDQFVSYSLSVQNRRKSRVGHALENHTQAVFDCLGIHYSRNARTEGHAKPDFIFPSIASYRDPAVASPPLAMLATKSTCKDRWRQILVEAARIPTKHLLTLETAISENQTAEMQANRVQLVVPRSVRPTYSQAQQDALITFSDFLAMINAR